MSFESTPNGKTNDNDTTMSFGGNTQLLAMKIQPGTHRISFYAPVCHYFESSTVHDECAKYWSSNNRSQLLGDMQLGTVNLSSLISNWDPSKYGEPPELDGPESKINLLNCSSQKCFLRPIFSLPRNGFFESESVITTGSKIEIPSESVITTGSKIEIPMSEVAKNKMSYYMSFNRYSYFFPRTNQCEWQRHFKLYGNEGEVVVSVHETMTLREFIQEHISFGALWKGGELFAADMLVGSKTVNWTTLGKYPAYNSSSFKIVPRIGQRPVYEGISTVGNGSWPEEDKNNRCLE